MKTKKKILSVLAIILGLAMIACLTFGLTACGDDGDGDEGKKLAAPTDFTFDLDTGEFSFIANDANVGYYYVRAFNVVNGKERAAYSATSDRIQGGDTGTKTGQIDMSLIGWGDYNIKLSTFAPAGTNYTAPDAVVLQAQFGIGGIMETPAFVAMYSGNTVELVIDWHTLTNYYTYEALPTIRFDFYSDEECTELVLSDEVETVVLLDTIDQHPANGGYIWGYSVMATFMTMTADGAPIGYTYDAYDYTTADLSAGTYYVTATALAPADYITDSETSDAVEFVLGEGAPNANVVSEDNPGGYVANYSEAWDDPDVVGVPCATPRTGRENCGVNQETTSRFV